MFQKYRISSLLRYISFALLFFIPARMAQKILPIAILPLVSVICMFLCVLISKKRGKILEVVGISFALFIILLFIPFIPPYFFQSLLYNRLYLHYRLSFWIIVITLLFSLLTTIFYYFFLKWKTIEPFFLICVLICLFWFENSHIIHLFSHPFHKALFAFIFLILQFIRLTLANNKHLSFAPVGFFIFFIPFLALLFFFSLGTYNSASVSTNSGLLQPTFFRFDFSPYLTLQNEIKMNDSLVFIVQAPTEYSTTFMRRVYLSGWDPHKGFFESPVPDEFPQQTKVPLRFTEFETDTFKLRELVSQDVFVVNFDPDSLIAFDYPVSVKPYHVWNSESFSGAYTVVSNTMGFFPFELFESSIPLKNEKKGLSQAALELYTKIDPQTKELLFTLTHEMTKDIPGYYDKILALTSFLRDGEYRYSLKPGIAADGNQLSHFLFTSKKGYCTYYAFSLALMLRSIGIPSRVAAGFFLQPDSATLNYFPVRANMAHAWVEVFFTNYGWISFDPTSTELAEGETLDIQMSPGGDEFLSLLGEIIENKKFLTEKTQGESFQAYKNPALRLISFVKNNFLTLLLSVFLLLSISIFFILVMYPHLYIKFSKNNRKKIFLFYNKAKKAIKNKNLSEYEHNSYATLFSLSQKAKFSPECSLEDVEFAKTLSTMLCKKRKKIAPNSIFYIFFALHLFIPLSLQAQETDLNELLSSAKNAINSENWEYALTILTSGEKQFPDEGEISYLLGTLYYDASLYDSAYKAYSKAEKSNFSTPDLFLNLSDTATYLNKDEEGLEWIKKHLEKYPEDLYGWSSFGWLCYKTNRLEEGIQNLHRIIETYGPDANLYASLANLYTASFNYSEAKKQYTQAIQISKERNQTYLSAIYYYNRSILEEIFYNFDAAYFDTVKSLEAFPRASGYLMQGELELKKLSFKSAFSLYMKAWNIDSSPLATIGVAETLLLAGHPEQALQYLEHALSRPDLFWIANYGTTTDQYKADLHKLQRNIYKYLKNKEKRKVVHNLSTLIIQKAQLIKYHFLTWKEDTFYRILSKKVSQQYEKTNFVKPRNSGIQLFIDSYYFQAFNSYKEISKHHLLQAKSIETDHIPASLPSYIFEEGVLNRDKSTLDESIMTLDPMWEKKYLAEALCERLKLTKRKNIDTYNQYAALLYSISPSSFVAHNISFPVTVSISYTNTLKQKNINSRLIHYLRKSGFTVTNSALYSLDILIEDSDIFINFVNKNNKATTYTQVIHNFQFSSTNYTELINNLSTSIFSIDLGLVQD